MAHGLPRHGQNTHAHQVVEEDGDDDGQLLQIVTVDIDVEEKADDAAGANKGAPVPLPATADGIEAARGGRWSRRRRRRNRCR